MIKKELLATINEQINFEYESAFLYKKMSIELGLMGWKGAAHWFNKQYQEEIGHADAMLHYVLEREEKPELKDVKMTKIELTTILDAFELAYKHERQVTEKIYGIVSMAIENKDYATENFFRKFVDEQVEEEATTSDLVERLKMASGNAGYMIIDQQLGAR